MTFSDQVGSISGTPGQTAAVVCDDGYTGGGTSTCTGDSGATTATWSEVTCAGMECSFLVLVCVAFLGCVCDWHDHV